MPKKQAKNAFFFFMEELRTQMEREEGVKFPNGWADVMTIASPKWQALTLEQKQPYEIIAKGRKNANKKGKMTTHGDSVLEVERRDEERTQHEERMHVEVRKRLEELGSIQAIQEEKFFIISFNTFCVTSEGHHIPAEVGLIEYSLLNGIENEYQKFIHPGRIPLGYSFVCKQKSEESHQIPYQNFELADNNYRAIYLQMKHMMGVSTECRKPIHVYCYPDEVDHTRYILNWLQNQANERGLSPFKVCYVTDLLVELRNFIARNNGEAFVPLELAVDILTKAIFDYIPDISCAYHEEHDLPKFCSLATVRRYCYLISDYVCESYGVEMKSRKHLPEIKPASECFSVTCPPGAASNIQRKSQKPTAGYAPGTTIITNVKSKFDDEQEKIIIPGQSPGVMTEMPKPMSNTAWGQPKAAASSTGGLAPYKLPKNTAAAVAGQPTEFQMRDEDFPGLGSDMPGLVLRPSMAYQAMGRGRGLGLQSTQQVEDCPDWTRLQAGLGRGKPKS